LSRDCRGIGDDQALVRRYLRVVTLEDGEAVHNAFFDRNFREDVR
jgi:hypothetical protein